MAKLLTKWHMATVQTQIRLFLRSSLIRVYNVCQSIKYFRKQLHKKQTLDKNVWNKVFEILGHLSYLLEAPLQGTSNEYLQHN